MGLRPRGVANSHPALRVKAGRDPLAQPSYIYLPFLPLAGRCDSAEPAATLAGLDVDDWRVLLAAEAARALVTFDEFDDLAMAHLTQVQVRPKVAAILALRKMS